MVKSILFLVFGGICLALFFILSSVVEPRIKNEPKGGKKTDTTIIFAIFFVILAVILLILGIVCLGLFLS